MSVNYQAEKNELKTANSVYFRPQEGENKIRIVSEPIKLWKAFDKTSKTAKVYLTEELAKTNKDAKKRFGMYVLNRAMNKVQIAEFGPQVWSQFLDLATSSEYGFDDLPPYDMILVKKGEGMETEYTLQAARNNTEITSDEQAMIKECEPLLNVIKKDSEEGKDEIKIDEIAPF